MDQRGPKPNKEPSKAAKNPFKVSRKRRASSEERFVDELCGTFLPSNAETRRAELMAKFPRPHPPPPPKFPPLKQAALVDETAIRDYHDGLEAIDRRFDEEVGRAYSQFLAYCEHQAQLLEAKMRKIARQIYRGEIVDEEDSTEASETCKPKVAWTPDAPPESDDDEDSSGPGSKDPFASSSTTKEVA
ncbi:hypothetical protein AAVH_26868 [Aphelenchoides avenae]|nr:hypothetical protein AAVH_36965 [Aphelenchus avenae]KAH7705915.1 hypothetical protein AAVH_26868 [Aphelenchus avenae]